MTARHLSLAAVEQIVDGLGDRDRAVVAGLARVRVLTGSQLERLHFFDLSPSTRGRMRRRVLARLVNLGLAATLERRVGGVRAGSAGLVYALGVAGQRALALLAADAALEPTRARKPWTPGALFLGHNLAVSELYVRLVEQQRAGTLALGSFLVEPAAWHPNGMGGVIKPDAYVLLRSREIEDSWWIEVDRATESLPTLRRKLLAYVDFAHAGQLGPDGVTPRVLVAVPHDARLAAVQELIGGLPEPAVGLLRVVLYEDAVTELAGVLREP